MSSSCISRICELLLLFPETMALLALFPHARVYPGRNFLELLTGIVGGGCLASDKRDSFLTGSVLHTSMQ